MDILLDPRSPRDIAPPAPPRPRPTPPNIPTYPAPRPSVGAMVWAEGPHGDVLTFGPICAVLGEIGGDWLVTIPEATPYATMESGSGLYELTTAGVTWEPLRMRDDTRWTYQAYWRLIAIGTPRPAVAGVVPQLDVYAVAVPA